ncbi:hypothetical protein AAG906_021230 [Vitis piasezkii]
MSAMYKGLSTQPLAMQIIFRPFDSFPIGVSAHSCPLNGPQQRCHLIRAQLVYLDFGP